LYQDKDYSEKYNNIVKKVLDKESKLFKNKIELPLTRKVALTLFRLMRYKDEYEVARLHTSGDFAKQFLSNNKEAKLEYYLAPPLFSKIDKDTGHLQKRRFGSWMFKAFKILSNFKFLRGTKFDLFGYTAERKSERVLAQKIMNTIIAITENLDQNNHKRILDFLEIPLSIKGYGHVKEKNMKIAETKWDKSLEKIINSRNLKKSA
jgi:indolepyruvate ferredoxin oxidoreductase